MSIKIRNTCFLLLFLMSVASYAQSYTISGCVKDAKSGETIPYATLIIEGSTQGQVTDINGAFSLDVKQGQTLLITYLSYKTEKITITQSKNDMVIWLEPQQTELEELSVMPDEDYAKVLFKRIVQNKKINREQISSHDYLSNIDAMTIYLAIDSGMDHSRFIRDLNKKSLFEEEGGIRFYPIFLSEETNAITQKESETLYEKKDGIFPKLNQTIESLISEYLVVDIDPYKNNIYILDKSFVSPISSTARIHYDIYLNDSTITSNGKYYHFSFKPKNKYSMLFSGSFSVDAKQYALRHIELYFNKNANVNFVNGFKANLNYVSNGQNKLYLQQQKLDINLSLRQSQEADTVYASERIKEVNNNNWLLKKSRSYSTERLDSIDAKYWKQEAVFQINTKDSVKDDHFLIVNEIKKEPLVNVVDGIGGAVLTSYISTSWLDIGPVFDIYSTNAIEGHRFSVPLRTNASLFGHFTIGGYVGYGTKTNELKFGANAGWQPLKNDKLVLRFSYADDYALLSQDKFLRYIKKNPNTRGNGNFIAALTSSVKDPYLKETEIYELRLEFNADKHFTLDLAPYYVKSYNTEQIRFVRNGTDYRSYDTYGALLNWRIAYNQNYDIEYFSRIYYITSKPIFNLSMDVGKVALNNENNLGKYAHVHGSVQGMIGLGQMAMRYMVNGGYLWGDIPYDMLEMPVGSRSLGYSKYRFNLLHQASFAHNIYANSHLELSGGGILFNKIPLLRQMKFREMVSLKTHIGSLTDGYIGVFDLPEYYQHELTYPYSELGIGVANLFKFIRVEYVRQLGNYHESEGIASRDGVRFRAEMSF